MAQGEVGIIETTKGTIKLSFFPEVAPNHVANFKKLASEGFYNGLIFHRVIPGFVVQGGCPNTRSEDRTRHGTGGPGYKVKAEFNQTPHDRGILSMARSSDPDSAGSQFFICLAKVPSLDRQYTVFGKVIEGMNVVDQIAKGPRDKKDNPVERMVMKKVWIQPAGAAAQAPAAPRPPQAAPPKRPS